MAGDVITSQYPIHKQLNILMDNAVPGADVDAMVNYITPIRDGVATAEADIEKITKISDVENYVLEPKMPAVPVF